MSRPNCVSLNPRSSLICKPMIEKMVHTAKHAVKANVLSHSARRCSPVETCARFFKVRPDLRSAESDLWMPDNDLIVRTGRARRKPARRENRNGIEETSPAARDFARAIDGRRLRALFMRAPN
ncbi:hypothetical protein [Amphiplicatus metriothermophilus]|uniref:hypothetical protein n=1 Tax=Amphiplicatus metriothermophilus TaxID=1519374 RepID=UPI00184AC071|nr:hypothetical protein [Amphiplicatus metriothermophilus]MBB5518464.1 hypothetical protein [Amphiplicatus metriothermophilus]